MYGISYTEICDSESQEEEHSIKPFCTNQENIGNWDSWTRWPWVDKEGVMRAAQPYTTYLWLTYVQWCVRHGSWMNWWCKSITRIRGSPIREGPVANFWPEKAYNTTHILAFTHFSFHFCPSYFCVLFYTYSINYLCTLLICPVK